MSLCVAVWMSPWRKGLVPFALRWLAAELPHRLGNTAASQDALYRLTQLCESEAVKAEEREAAASGGGARAGGAAEDAAAAEVPRPFEMSAIAPSLPAAANTAPPPPPPYSFFLVLSSQSKDI